MKVSLPWVVALALSASVFTASTASAQDSRWNAEASVGWDVNLSGDFLSSGIGTLNGVPVVFQSQPFGDVYGTGINWTFGAGYKLDEQNEIRAEFAYQRAGADAVTLGTAGTSTLMATFDDYKASSIQAGYRRYFEPRMEHLRPYASGLFGVLQKARDLGLAVPRTVWIIAVEAADCTTVGGSMHPAIEDAIEPALATIAQLVSEAVDA